MTAEDRADMLNEIQNITEKYGYDVAGYEEGINDKDIFEILLIKR